MKPELGMVRPLILLLFVSMIRVHYGGMFGLKVILVDGSLHPNGK